MALTSLATRLTSAGAAAGVLTGVLAALASPAPARAFGFYDVAARAQLLAQKPYQAPASTVPADLARLSYDQYRDIRFKPERALWRGTEGSKFQLMFFHLGKHHSLPVRINIVGADGVRPVAFDRNDFDYGPSARTTLKPEKWGDLGFAGFRVHYPLNRPDYPDELAVFLGASYFRVLGSGQHYGLSARGLALDTADGALSKPAASGSARPVNEEFPRFTEFWIERPAAGATTLTVYALLESPRSAGAYKMVLKPGTAGEAAAGSQGSTTMDVQARLYLRPGVRTLGLAPLTSMFLHGENQPAASADFRPEVHDSDGLSVASTDASGRTEWLWRPLQNPAGVLATSFAVPRLQGFGLMQRDRAFASYQDAEARYEARPSTWVQPLGDWGAGRVELLQFRADDETVDNVAAYWVPAQPPAPGRPFDYSYRLHWQGAGFERPPTAWVVQTRRGPGFVNDTAARDPGDQFYVVDFTGPALQALAPDAAVQAVVSTNDNAKLVERNAYRLPAGEGGAPAGWRMTVRVQRLDPAKPVELRAFLQSGPHALSETWTHIIPPQ